MNASAPDLTVDNKTERSDYVAAPHHAAASDIPRTQRHTHEFLPR